MGYKIKQPNDNIKEAIIEKNNIKTTFTLGELEETINNFKSKINLINAELEKAKAAKSRFEEENGVPLTVASLGEIVSLRDYFGVLAYIPELESDIKQLENEVEKYNDEVEKIEAWLKTQG